MVQNLRDFQPLSWMLGKRGKEEERKGERVSNLLAPILQTFITFFSSLEMRSLAGGERSLGMSNSAVTTLFRVFFTPTV